MTERLVPNSARFPDQTIDDETLLFDADTGHLLLLVGFGSILWTHLVAGVGANELRDTVAARFGATAGAETQAFLDDLRAAGILILSSDPPPKGAEEPAAWPAVFTTPGVERYDDIAKIIAMDPIHDVDATTGWPRIAPEGKA